MSRNKTYIVSQMGPRQNGSIPKVIAARYRVGANSEKDAIALCQQQIDKTTSYTARFNPELETTHGIVARLAPSPNPYVQYKNELWILTDEVKIIVENGVTIQKMKIINQHSHSKNIRVAWV